MHVFVMSHLESLWQQRNALREMLADLIDHLFDNRISDCSGNLFINMVSEKESYQMDCDAGLGQEFER